MGQFINIGNSNFKRARASEYIDKSELISYINSTLDTESNMSCVTRCRRFGKSMAAGMLCAYYDKSCDSHVLFQDLIIAKDPTYEKHLNKYPVIFISMSDFISQYGHNLSIVEKAQQALTDDILATYPNFNLNPGEDLMGLLLRIAESTGEKFIMIIDEWDALCREFKEGEGVMDDYVNLLRRFFKGLNTSRVFAGAYITGILPIKKYNTESALNNFREYTMLYPGKLATLFGFTPDEVIGLCNKYHMDYEQIKQWYDGYQIGKAKSMYNPNSVMQALQNQECISYWSATGAFDNVSKYIQMDYEGLKRDILGMLAGERCSVRYGRFGNDLKQIKSKDDVFTVLIHLGYLSYDSERQKCYIPNGEVRQEMEYAIMESNWQDIIDTINASENLLISILNGDSKAVEIGIEKAHQRSASILQYNDENSLSCALNLALYTAHKDYSIIREMPAGKGFADLVFIPRKNDLPALVVELKYNKNVNSAIDQIKNKQYPVDLQPFSNNVILVGINYNPSSKRHSCLIEKLSEQ